jgi:hypothetical protein
MNLNDERDKSFNVGGSMGLNDGRNKSFDSSKWFELLSKPNINFSVN